MSKETLGENLGFVKNIIAQPKGLIPRQRNSSQEAVYARYGWLGMNGSIEFSRSSPSQ